MFLISFKYVDNFCSLFKLLILKDFVYLKNIATDELVVKLTYFNNWSGRNSFPIKFLIVETISN